MELSVVVPTLNDRERLATCLDSLADHASDAEVVVVNGPSADGTTGMVRDRDDVSVLVQISERNINVARNAGIEAASGDVVALVSHEVEVEPSWLDDLQAGLADGVSAVTGPAHSEAERRSAAESEERSTIAGRDVTYFNGDNVALTWAAIEALDGFDEYLVTGGARDAAHRLAAQGRDVAWTCGMSVRIDGDESSYTVSEWGQKYHSLAYRLAKNYGPHPTVLRRTIQHGVADAGTSATDVLSGEVTPTTWVANGRAVCTSMLAGFRDGLMARVRDRTSRRNPNGVSARIDRAVERYDWR